MLYYGGGNKGIHEDSIGDVILDGWTGINEEKFKDRINHFMQRSIGALTSYVEAYKYLFDELYFVWASPNAKDFSHRTIENHEALIKEFKFSVAMNVRSAYRAYNIMADANGMPRINTDSEFGVDGSGNIVFYGEGHRALSAIHSELKELESERLGTTGMNTELVSMILKEFCSKLERANFLFEWIPGDIGLLDSMGHIVRAYKTSIRKTIEKIQSSELETFGEIKKYIETESDNIILASHQATDAINTVQI